MKPELTSVTSSERRSFLKKTAYVAPAIISLTALPSFASVGSGYRPKDHDNPYWKAKKDWWKSKKAYNVLRKEVRVKIRELRKARRDGDKPVYVVKRAEVKAALQELKKTKAVLREKWAKLRLLRSRGPHSSV